MLTSYEKFFQSLLIQFPFPHIFIKRLDPLIFVFQYFVKISGAKQLYCLSRIPKRQLLKIVKTLYLPIARHNIRFLDNRGKCDIILAAVANDRKLPMFDMPRHQPAAVICIIYIDRIPVETLFVTLHTIRRGIDKTSDRSFPLIFQWKTSSVFFPFSDSHYNMCFRKYNFRLRNMKVAFGKSFDLILQICHLLIIFAAVRA